MKPIDEKKRESDTDSAIGIALSGGGHRASLFGLGALLYIVDSGFNERVSAISSVSGGSITNAFVASECDFQHLTDKEEFYGVASRLARIIVLKGVNRLSFLSTFYISLLVLIGLLILTATAWAWPREIQWYQSMLSFFVLGVLLILRGWVLECLLGTALFSESRRTFKEINANCWHILCATDLIAGTPFFFVGGPNSYTIDANNSPDGDPDWSNIHGDSSNITLRAAVRASAAFPGALPPRRFWFRPRGGRPRLTYLGDGGTWNNLGTQWWDRFRGKSILDPSTGSLWRPDKLLVIDASAPSENLFSSFKLFFPWVAEYSATKRAVEVLFANTLGPRLYSLHQQRHRRNKWKTVAVVSIRNQLGDYAKSIAHGRGGPPPVKKTPWRIRAEEWLEYQKTSLREIDPLSLMTSCSKVKTTLSRIPGGAAVNLIITGYLQTMEAMHIDFNAPLSDFAGTKYFEKLLED